MLCTWFVKYIFSHFRSVDFVCRDRQTNVMMPPLLPLIVAFCSEKNSPSNLLLPFCSLILFLFFKLCSSSVLFEVLFMRFISRKFKAIKEEIYVCYQNHVSLSLINFCTVSFVQHFRLFFSL